MASINNGDNQEHLDINAGNSSMQHQQGTTSDELADTLTSTNRDMSENDFHKPVYKEVHTHLHDNVSRIFLKELRNKEVYTKYNICVDGREEGEGIASFGGFAGILGATLPALKELHVANPHDIIKGWLGETKFYVHCDEHTQHETHGATYCDCKKIGCGAINLMLQPTNSAKYSAEYGYDDADRAYFWKLIDSNANVTVLKGEHEEQGIIMINNQVRKDKETNEEYINHTSKNMKDGVQYFVSHNTGRNIIIDYFAEDLAHYIIQTNGLDQQDGFDQEAMIYSLKAKIMEWADKHAGTTLGLLGAAQKVFTEKGDDAVITLNKISNKGNHVFHNN